MFKLYIKESYYRDGLARIEYFNTEKKLVERRAALSQDGRKLWDNLKELANAVSHEKASA